MSATNATTNYQFPLFIGSDKPAWLVDWNGAMSAIDNAIHEAKAEADATDLIVTGHTSAIQALQSSVGDQSTAIQGLRTDVDDNTGSINTINSLIGNGKPTTTDKTLIGAINELDSDVTTLNGVVAAKNGNTLVNAKSILAEVTADGVKTFTTLLDELNAAMYTAAQNLADGYFVLGQNIVISDIGFIPLRDEILYNNQTAQFSFGGSFTFGGSESDLDYIRCYFIRCLTSGSTYYITEVNKTVSTGNINLGTNVMDNLIPTAGIKIQIVGNLYKTI